MDRLLLDYSDEQLDFLLDFIRRLTANNIAEAGRTAA
jgi:hypothetical protein